MIALAADHAGFELKNEVADYLRHTGRDVRDLGTSTTESVDYPDFGHRLAVEVSSGRADVGILICGTGIGVSITANRHSGIRAALCHDAYTAEMARRHNDANVLCLGGRVVGIGVAEQAVEVFLTTAFEGGRHQRRVDKIELEKP